MIGKVLLYIVKNPSKARLGEQVRFVPNAVGSESESEKNFAVITFI